MRSEGPPCCAVSVACICFARFVRSFCLRHARRSEYGIAECVLRPTISRVTSYLDFDTALIHRTAAKYPFRLGLQKLSTLLWAVALGPRLFERLDWRSLGCALAAMALLALWLRLCLCSCSLFVLLLSAVQVARTDDKKPKRCVSRGRRGAAPPPWSLLTGGLNP